MHFARETASSKSSCLADRRGMWVFSAIRSNAAMIQGVQETYRSHIRGPEAADHCIFRSICSFHSFVDTFFLPSKASIFPQTSQWVFVAVSCHRFRCGHAMCRVLVPRSNGFPFWPTRIIGRDGRVFPAHRIGDKFMRLNFVRTEVIDNCHAQFPGRDQALLALVPGFFELLQLRRLRGFFGLQTTGVSFRPPCAPAHAAPTCRHRR